MGSQAVDTTLAAEQQPLQQRFGGKNVQVPLTAGIIELQLTQLDILAIIPQLKIHNLSHTW